MRISVLILFLCCCLSSCSVFKKKDIEIENKTWILELLDQKAVVQSKPISLKLDAKSKRFNAYSGCNYINGTYSLIETELSFGVLQQTYKACQTIAVEQKFIKNLKATSHYKLRRGRLILFQAEKELASFK